MLYRPYHNKNLIFPVPVNSADRSRLKNKFQACGLDIVKPIQLPYFTNKLLDYAQNNRDIYSTRLKDPHLHPQIDGLVLPGAE